MQHKAEPKQSSKNIENEQSNAKTNQTTT